ncbi:MAG TPA: right-handed parallel beta-helix repeat-containing protein, partial [Nitrolancea sp.]|nr:right-handed parallel beta-helix repeat-containing protein [Nitrolancea sp.]
INLCCMPGSSMTGSTVNGINLNAKSYLGVYGCTESGAGDTGIVNSGTSSHHTIEYNSISGNGAGGIAINNSDYDTIEHNGVHGNAGTNASDFSGISLYEPVAFDSVVGIHNRIAYNASYSNLNPSGGTDGNGIILDTFSNTAYTGETVVDDNVNWLNNGACVKVYSAGAGAQNFVVNNSCFHNWQGNWNGSWRHEIEYESSADNPIVANNLVVPDSSVLNNWTTGVAYDGGTGTPVVGNNTGAAVNFFFLEPPTDMRQLFASASRAAGLATISSTPVYVPALDAQGVPRPAAFDVGAYQYRASVFSQP